MKGGVEYTDDDPIEEELDPASTVDFNMKGLKSKFLLQFATLQTFFAVFTFQIFCHYVV